MVICPKCNNENPDDAAFCGFCGSNMVEEPAPEAAKTVYGYEVDPEKMGEAAGLQPVPEVADASSRSLTEGGEDAGSPDGEGDGDESGADPSGEEEK